MVFPPVFAWMEETDHCLTRGVRATDMRGLIEIASTAGQRPVGRSVLTTTGDRYDMFHLHGQVEHRFWRMAIFTAIDQPTALPGDSAGSSPQRVGQCGSPRRRGLQLRIDERLKLGLLVRRQGGALVSGDPPARH